MTLGSYPLCAGKPVNVYGARKVYTIALTRTLSCPRRSTLDCQARSSHYQHRRTEHTLNLRRGGQIRGRAPTVALLVNGIFCFMFMAYCLAAMHAILEYQYLGTTKRRGSTQVSSPAPIAVIPLNADIDCRHWKTYKVMDPTRYLGLLGPVWWR